jgi:hypothetical protein
MFSQKSQVKETFTAGRQLRSTSNPHELGQVEMTEERIWRIMTETDRLVTEMEYR